MNVAAFELVEAADVRVGDRLWVNGASYVVRANAPGRFKSSVRISLRGAEPRDVSRFKILAIAPRSAE